MAIVINLGDGNLLAILVDGVVVFVVVLVVVL